MTQPELIAYMGDDAKRWTAEFCKLARDQGHKLDEGWVFAWFANAIEHSYMVRVMKASQTDTCSAFWPLLSKRDAEQ